jgi:hypothetical protein
MTRFPVWLGEAPSPAHCGAVVVENGIVVVAAKK